MTEFNLVRAARWSSIGVEHECTNTILELGRDIVDLVGSESVRRVEGVGVVGGRVGDLVVGPRTQLCVAIALLLSVGLLDPG